MSKAATVMERKRCLSAAVANSQRRQDVAANFSGRIAGTFVIAGRSGSQLT
jgi:hypothetical protein